MQKKHRKLIAPILVTLLVVFYFGGFLRVSLLQPVPVSVKIGFVVIPLLLIGVSIFVLVERIKEIRSGEEDDLSKY